jgi:hypothetical protein
LQVLIEDQERLADRIHDRLGERASIIDVHERLTIGRGQCVCRDWALQQGLRSYVYSPKKRPVTNVSPNFRPNSVASRLRPERA